MGSILGEDDRIAWNHRLYLKSKHSGVMIDLEPASRGGCIGGGLRPTNDASTQCEIMKNRKIWSRKCSSCEVMIHFSSAQFSQDKSDFEGQTGIQSSSGGRHRNWDSPLRVSTPSPYPWLSGGLVYARN